MGVITNSSVNTVPLTQKKQIEPKKSKNYDDETEKNKNKNKNEIINRELLKDPEIQEIENEYQRQLKKKEEEIRKENELYKREYIRPNKESHIICSVADGSETSKQGIRIVTEEFLSRIKNSILMCPFIYDEKNEEYFNWRYQRQFAFDYFKTYLINTLPDDRGYLMINNRNTYFSHEIVQIYSLADKNNCDYLFVGYNGLKGGIQKESNINQGLIYLLCESKIPIFIMKDKLLRGQRNKGYKWLILMDRNNKDCYKVFDYFYPLMDVDKDFIYGLTILPRNVTIDDIQRQFIDKVSKCGFNMEKQFKYENVEYQSKLSEFLKQFVNHSLSDYFDFVIFYNNDEKSKVQRLENESLKLLNVINANIGFVNGGLATDFDFNIKVLHPKKIEPPVRNEQNENLQNEDIKEEKKEDIKEAKKEEKKEEKKEDKKISNQQSRIQSKKPTNVSNKSNTNVKDNKSTTTTNPKKPVNTTTTSKNPTLNRTTKQTPNTTKPNVNKGKK